MYDSRSIKVIHRLFSESFPYDRFLEKNALEKQSRKYDGLIITHIVHNSPQLIRAIHLTKMADVFKEKGAFNKNKYNYIIRKNINEYDIPMIITIPEMDTANIRVTYNSKAGTTTFSSANGNNIKVFDQDYHNLPEFIKEEYKKSITNIKPLTIEAFRAVVDVIDSFVGMDDIDDYFN